MRKIPQRQIHEIAVTFSHSLFHLLSTRCQMSCVPVFITPVTRVVSVTLLSPSEPIIEVLHSVSGLFLQHEVDHKPDLRLGGVGGPGPPPLTNHVAPPLPAPPPPSQSVINVHPPPGPAPAPVRPPPPASVPPAPSLAPKPQSQPAAKAISPSEPTHNNVSDIPVLPTIKPKPAPAPAPAPVRPSQSAPVPIISAPAPRPDVLTPSVPAPGVTRQPAALQPVAPEPGPARGRTPTRQERSRAAQHNDTGAAQGPAGGYNFQKIMDDRFEHYKRPPSRERSAGLGSRQGSRQQLGGVSRDASRDRLHQPQAAARPASRQRTPMAGELAPSDNKNNGLDSLNLDGASAVKQTGNGSIAGNNFSTDFKLPAEDQIRFRGVQQEIPHFGAVPKRTESLYMKPGQNNQQATCQVNRLESHPILFSASLFFIPRHVGAGQLSNAEEEVAPRRGVSARGDSEAGERRHDQGGDLSAELRPQGRDQAPAGGGREVPGQPCPLYPQSSYSGEQTVTSKVHKVIIYYQSLIFLFPLSMCHRKFIFIDPLNSILEKIILNLICKES